MSLPSTAWLACACLLWAAATPAQPRAPRERKERQASLLRDPAEPVPQVRVAAGVLTSLSFNAPLARAQAEDHERFHRLDLGERALYLKPALDLAATERLALHLTFVDGRKAVLLLISHPTEVDARVDFVLPERSAEACERELASTLARYEARSRELEKIQGQCAETGPALLALAGSFQREIRRKILPTSDSPALLRFSKGWAYRLRGWMVLTGRVTNTGTAPWMPVRAHLTPAEPGVQVRVVFPTKAALRAGAGADIAIEVKVPGELLAPSTLHDLTLCDGAQERCLSVPDLELE
ncbi:DUF2381 family protein [Hyalangium gracile]|uniref:DUF2381 family protein n=1 Tax=Hyalangium gracile TaxID=394092 RepID=UPI001CCB3468|nr:DUF2381 family protein [Hyalangium gracile]